MTKPDKFQLKQISLQENNNSKLRKAFNDNLNTLAYLISSTSNKNTNYNKNLSKKFTENKRKLRKELIEFITIATEKASKFADDKNTSFLKDIEEKL